METLNPLQPLTLAAAASLLIIPPMWWLAPRLGLVDVPNARKVHSAPVPRVGGWGITLGALIPLLLWFRLDSLLQSFVLGSLTLFLFGVWDDARNIGHWVKFFGQAVAAGLVVYHGGLYVSHVPFTDEMTLPPMLGKPFTMFAVIGVINATNHSDGLDGLAAGESILSLIALAILGYLSNCPLVVAIALAAIGGLLGFLRYNSHPARVFMGDSGSQVLGFTLAFLTVYLTQVGNAALSDMLPVLLLGLPLADLLGVLLLRIRRGANWFEASRNHVHHRLLDLGFSHHETVIIIYTIQAALVLCAVLLRYAPDVPVMATYLVIVGLLFAALTVAEGRGWRAILGDSHAHASFARSLLEQLRRSKTLQESPRRLISIVVPAFMLLGSLWAGRVPRDFAAVAAVLAAVVGTEMCLARAAGSVLVRVAVYVTAVACTYLMISYPGIAERSVEVVTLAAVGLLAIASGMYVQFATETKFGTTPTDYLIVFVVLALLVFGGIDIGARVVVEIVVFSVVLLYSCEVLIGRSLRRWNVLHLSTLASLTVMAVRGVL